MVQKILNLIHREVRGLHEAAYLLGLFAFFSQILALVRDRLLAHSFGAGPTLDVYYASFRIPDIVFVSLASLVSIYVLIPFLAEKTSLSKEAEKKFINNIFTVFSGTMVIVAGILFFLTPLVTRLLFPGFADGPLYGDLVLVTRILLLQPFFLGLSGLFGSITQTHQRFILYAISPLLYNAGIIVGLLLFYPIFGIAGLAYGVVLGALLHLVIQLPYIIQKGFFPKLVFTVNWHEIKKVVTLSLPRTLALSANQIALLVLVALASRMVEGSITVFTFSYNLQAVPLSIVAVSYSVAAFPTLAKLFSSGDKEKFLLQVLVATRHIIFWSMPAIALFIVLRAQIVRVILGSGAFDWADTRLTAAALSLFIVSLVAQGLILLFVRGYYAAGNTRKPLIINLLGAFFVVVFSFIFLKLFASVPLWQYFMESLFRVEGLSGTRILMLPLGYSLSLLLTAVAFWVLFQRDFSSFSSSLSRVFFQSMAAAVVAGFVAHQFLDVFDDIVDINTFIGIFTQGFFAGIIGISAGVLLLRLLGSRELDEVWRSFHRKFWKTKTITPEQTEL